MNWDRDEEQELEALEAAEQIDAMPNQEQAVNQIVSEIMQPVQHSTNVAKFSAFQDRLDLAALYRILLNIPSFFNPDGNIKKELTDRVDTELKNFVIQRLEILLGMRTEAPKTALSPRSVQWINSKTDQQLAALDMLLNKIAPAANSTAVQPAPTVSQPARETTVATVSTASVAAPAPKKKVQRQPIANPTPQQSALKNLTKEQIANLPREELAILLAREASAQGRVGQVGQNVPGKQTPAQPNRKPMPTPEQEAAKVMSEVTTTNQAQTSNPLMTAILTKVMENAQTRGDE